MVRDLPLDNLSLCREKVTIPSASLRCVPAPSHCPPCKGRGCRITASHRHLILPGTSWQCRVQPTWIHSLPSHQQMSLFYPLCINGVILLSPSTRLQVTAALHHLVPIPVLSSSAEKHFSSSPADQALIQAVWSDSLWIPAESAVGSRKDWSQPVCFSLWPERCHSAHSTKGLCAAQIHRVLPRRAAALQHPTRPRKDRSC